MGVYFVQIVDDGPIKIGFSADPALRLSALQSWSPWTLKLLAHFAFWNRLDERQLHERFSTLRIRGEWYRSHESIFDLIEKPTAPVRGNISARDRLLVTQARHYIKKNRMLIRNFEMSILDCCGALRRLEMKDEHAPEIRKRLRLFLDSVDGSETAPT